MVHSPSPPHLLTPASSPPSPLNPWPRAILHLDMDAFYVNVHLLDHPADGGVPLVVGGQPDQRGVVSSASYEARKLGIHSAMSTAVARRLCPSLKIVPVNWERVRECSRQIMDILRQFGPVEKMSVDEAYVDLTAWDEPGAKAGEVRTAVKTQTHLPCSVGLASSKLVAKVASDHDKPEGFTIVPPGTEATFLAPLPTRALWGIGPKTAEKLARQGLHTCGDLAAADITVLRPVVGNQAAALKARAAGIDDRPVQAEHGPPKSISQEWTFNTDVDDTAVLCERLQKMCHDVAEMLQKEKLAASTVSVKFRWADFTTYTRQRSVAVPFADAATLYEIAHALWDEHWPRDKKLRLLGVAVSKLDEAQVRQLGFDFG
ncbi:MAG: DNA polymerase IV [Anaerolineae bacterium]|nr:DNA polymerase IV [Anaerolineae bacterium]